MRAACPECDDFVIEPVLIDRLPARDPAVPNAINNCLLIQTEQFRRRHRRRANRAGGARFVEALAGVQSGRRHAQPRLHLERRDD